MSFSVGHPPSLNVKVYIGCANHRCSWLAYMSASAQNNEVESDSLCDYSWKGNIRACNRRNRVRTRQQAALTSNVMQLTCSEAKSCGYDCMPLPPDSVNRAIEYPTMRKLQQSTLLRTIT